MSYKKNVAIIFDTSSSMLWGKDKQPALFAALEDAAIIKANLSYQDTLICFADDLPAASNLEHIHAITNDIIKIAQLSLKRAPLDSLIIQALQELRKRQNQKNIVLIMSDMQYATWKESLADGLMEYAGREFRDVLKNTSFLCLPYYHSYPATNFALIDFSANPPLAMQADQISLSCSISNAGNIAISPGNLEIKANGSIIFTTNLTTALAPAAVTNVVHKTAKLPAGEHVFTAVLKNNDEILADNSRHCVIRVLPPISMLIVDGKHLTDFPENSAEIIKMVFSSSLSMDGKQQVLCNNIAKINYTDLKNYSSFKNNDIVVLANVDFLPAIVAEALLQFVEGGGLLFIAAGNKVEPEFYNNWKSRSGEHVLPALLKDTMFFPPSEWQINLSDAEGLKGKNIEDEKNFWLEKVVVSSLWRLEPRNTPFLFSVSFQNGVPLLMCNKIGNGAVLLSAMSFERREGDLIEKPFFAPLLYEVLHCAFIKLFGNVNFYSRESSRIGLIPLHPIFSEDSYSTETVARVSSAYGKQITGHLITQGRKTYFEVAPLYDSGLYEFPVPAHLENKYGKKIHINVLDEVLESDATPVSKKELQAMEEKLNVCIIDSIDDVLRELRNEVRGIPLWRYLLVLVVVLFIGELMITKFFRTGKKAKE
jgi:hypothetical protein